MKESLKDLSGKNESLSHLVIDIFQDFEKLMRQELNLFVAKAQDMIEQRAKQIPRYHWLALCVAITVVFAALTLVEAFKTIPGLSMLAVYGLCGLTFLALGVIGYAITGNKKEKSEMEKNKEQTVKLASVHSLIEGESHA